MPAIVETVNLNKRYAEVEAVRGIICAYRTFNMCLSRTKWSWKEHRASHADGNDSSDIGDRTD